MGHHITQQSSEYHSQLKKRKNGLKIVEETTYRAKALLLVK